MSVDSSVLFRFVLKEIQIFALRLEQISSKIPVNPEVARSLWENIAHIITHTLVQGLVLYIYIFLLFWVF